MHFHVPCNQKSWDQQPSVIILQFDLMYNSSDICAAEEFKNEIILKSEQIY